MTREHHRPVPVPSAFFAEVPGGTDPVAAAEAAERAAVLLLRGARTAEDRTVVDRVVALADTEDIEAIAALWAGAPPESLGGCLWRLYALRAWVNADPVQAAREYDAGRPRAEVAGVVAGVADPPGPDEVRDLLDRVLRGLGEGELADVLFRAAAFARVVATGRAVLGRPAAAAAKMMSTADHLDRAGHAELRHGLG